MAEQAGNRTLDAGGIEYDMAYYSASGRHKSYSFLAQRYEMDAESIAKAVKAGLGHG